MAWRIAWWRVVGIVLAALLLPLAAGDGARALAEPTRPAPTLAGEPPAAPVMIDGRLAGYVFRTRDVMASVGYSGRSFDVLVGLDLDGKITGARLLEHNEPVLVIGVAPGALAHFIDGFGGVSVSADTRISRRPAAAGGIDGVSGATVSSTLVADAILRAARAVALDRGIIAPPPTTAGLDLDLFAVLDWDGLVEAGLLSRLRLTNRDISEALTDLGREPEPIPAAPNPADMFVDLWVALATPAMIGGNLLGESRHRAMRLALEPGDQAIVVLAGGRYSVKGTSWVRTGIFDRLQVRQGTATIRLEADRHTRLDGLAIEGAPAFRELGWFELPEDSSFDPLRPWHLRLLVEQSTRGGDFYLAFGLPVTAPTALLETAGPAGEPDGLVDQLRRAAAEPDGPLVVSAGLWLDIWAERWRDIALLGGLLLIFTQALVFQDALARRQALYRRFRTGFLLVVLLWLGLAMGAQLSVINVLTFIDSLLTGFSWQVFLLEPLIFILWSYVALALLFLGRGVFCGWLCPFGALQELTNKLARLLRALQVALPFGLHERLWPLKYIVFLGLLAVLLHAMNIATIAAEVEPFKTAINMHFARAWPYVLYATALLLVGLFIERFYCRYVCPLGAVLAIPARLSTFRWLKRRPQCGRECRICAVRCPVQAIHPAGEINPNECVYCLDCQIRYQDDHTCPPLINRRRRREAAAPRATAAGSPGREMAAPALETR